MKTTSKKREKLRKAFHRVRKHMRTPEGRTATSIANFLREIAANAAKAEKAGDTWTDTPSELLEDIASRIDEGQGWV